MVNLLSASADALGDLLREMCATLPKKSKSVPDWVIKVHNLKHWSYFITRFGGLKNFDVQVFESEHKIYKVMFHRTTRTKNDGLSETETLEYSIVRMYIQRLSMEVDEIITSRDTLRDGVLSELEASRKLHTTTTTQGGGWIMRKSGSLTISFTPTGAPWRNHQWRSMIACDNHVLRRTISQSVLSELINGRLLGKHQKVTSLTFHTSARAIHLLKSRAISGTSIDARNVDVYSDGSKHRNTANTALAYNSVKSNNEQIGIVVGLLSVHVSKN